MKNEIKEYSNKVFEDIKHLDENGNEYWFARELQKLLEYKKWDNFHIVIKKAVIAYRISNNVELYWLPEIKKPIKIGKGKEKVITDYQLSRYICYLIAQNGDPRKEVIALAQTYFSVQTRKRELTEIEYSKLSETMIIWEKQLIL
jgi:DNA-damage-inducible protein D